MSPDSPANLHWVKVTGVVDTSARGRIGDEPFGLLQKNIEILPASEIEKGDGMAVAKSATEKVFARCALTPRGSERYYDAHKHAYYYCVTNNGINRVLPSDAKAHWRLFPTPDRN